MSRPLPVYYTAAEVAEVLRVKPITVYDLIKTGKLRATKPELKWLIKDEDLQAYLASGEDVA